jgi:peptidyl-prolyl cis-trans isomerase D
MALIGTLRNKMGTWVVIFVFVAISAFIMNDLLGKQSVLFNNNDVGEIAGHDVSYEEFQQAVRDREASYVMNSGRQPGEREMTTLRQQAWELLILRYAIQKEYAKVGVDVTMEEQEDMIYGKNVDQNIKNAFTNPETNEFDRDRLLTYMKDLSTPPAEPQMQEMWQKQRTGWELFQRDLKPGRERIKYENLLIKSSYVTTAEAEREYHVQNDVAEIKYLYIPYYAISDSAAAVTDSDLKDYYNKNIEKFKTEAARDIKYVQFDVVASSKDSVEIKNEMEKLAAEFVQTEDDSTFAATNTEGAEPYRKYNVSDIPSFIQAEDLKQGKVIGPFIDGTAYKLVKISKITKDTVFNARAKHILIKWENDSDAAKKAAKEKARNILKDIKAGADFGLKAREFGSDGTATRGGDLGWFSTGRMVKPFENAVFGATKPGLLNDVVETDFGYHIISVTNTKDNAAYEIATIERAIAPSDETTNEAYRKAETFAADLDNLKQFEEKAKKEGYIVQEAKNIGTDERRVGNLGEARQVVQWLFKDADVNDVSEVFDLQDKYAVAIVTAETKKGYKPLETVKEEITPEARKQVKGRLIIDKLKGMKGTLEEVANQYGTEATVNTSNDLKLNSNNLPQAGRDPIAVGLAFSLENGKRTAPLAGENGVFIIETQNKTTAPEIADYSTYKTTLEQNSVSRNYNVGEAIKEYAKIEDKRYKFY